MEEHTQMNGNGSNVNGQEPEEQQEQIPAFHPIHDVLNQFISHVDSLAETLPLTMFLIYDSRRKAQKELEEFENQYCELIEENEQGKKLQLSEENWYQFSNHLKKLEKSSLAYQLVPRSFVVSLVSQYDAFLGGLIRALFTLRPEVLNASERSLSLAELMEFDSIGAAREHILEKEVETVLRKSHAEQFEWLENKFNIPLRKGLDIWPDFIEVTERRNLFVHANGIVSTHYINVCQNHDVKFTSDIQSGVQLGVSRKYFDNAYQCILELAIKLAHVLWRKIDSKSREEADRSFVNITYELLQDEKWQLAQKLLDFATETEAFNRNFSSEKARRTVVINRAQAYKWAGDQDKALRILKREDWSATSDEFKLAEAVLLDDFEQANIILRKIGTSDPMGKANLKGWPLFRKYRETEGFLSVYEEIFQEPFHTVEIDPTKAEEPSINSEKEQFESDEDDMSSFDGQEEDTP